MFQIPDKTEHSREFCARKVGGAAHQSFLPRFNPGQSFSAGSGCHIFLHEDQEELEAMQRKIISFDFSFAFGCRATYRWELMITRFPSDWQTFHVTNGVDPFIVSTVITADGHPRWGPPP
jgi:hypothetical protein